MVRRRSSSSSCRGTGSVEKEREYRSMKVINILNMAIAMVLVKSNYILEEEKKGAKSCVDLEEMFASVETRI